MAALHYPYRPPRGGMYRNASHESILKKQPVRPPITQPFYALTREEMGWEKSKETGPMREKDVRRKPPKPRFKLNKTQKREYGWNTSYPAEYGIITFAQDFKNTLSYTQNKIKELQERKQLLQASASASQILDSDVWRNHNDTSTLSHLHAAFNCTQPVPISDPQDEIRIMKAILIREGFITQLKGIAQKIRIGDHSSLQAEDGNSVLSVLLQTREASLRVIDALVRWNSTLSSSRAYIWSNRSYAHRMLDDLNFLAEVPTLADALGVAPRSMLRNPFMLPTSIADRDLEPFRYMLSPPSVTIPSDAKELIAVEEADAFLIWCCIHLSEEYDEASIENDTPSPSKTPSTSQTSKIQHVLRWQRHAEQQLKLLSMPMESTTGVHVMDSSALMKRRGHLPSLSVAPPETLHELIQHVHEVEPKKPSAYAIHPATIQTNPKYANVKPRVSAEPKLHQMKQKEIPPSNKPPKSRLKKRKPKEPPTTLIIQDLQVTSAELEALGKVETPPQVIALLAATILILLAPGDLVPKDVTWNTSRTLLADGRELLRTLHAFSKGPSVPEFKLRALQPFLANERFRPQYLLSISSPAATLCAWVLETVRPDRAAASSCRLVDPVLADAADRVDLLSYLENDSKICHESTADVLVVHDQVDSDERLLYTGTWHFRGLAYVVSFFLAHPSPPLLHLKMYEPRSSCETQSRLTAAEIEQLFGSVTLQYMKANAWIELCQLILSQLDQVITNSPSMNAMENSSKLPSADDDAAELWNELATPRVGEEISQKQQPTSSLSDIEAAVVRIQCATRQKLSREKVKRIRAQRAMRKQFQEGKQKAPTLYMSGAALRALDEEGREKPKKNSVQHHRSIIELQDTYAVDVNSEWATIEANAMSGMRHASRRRLSSASLSDLEAIILHAPRGTQHKKAIVQVQSLARQKTAKKRVHNLRQTKLAQDKAVVQIQCAARQKLARTSIERQRSNAHQRIKVDAATRIQSIARRQEAKKLVQSKRQQKQLAQFRDESAVRIQSIARQRQARKRVSTIRRERNDFRATEQNEAALNIQCMTRQKLARDIVNKRRCDTMAQSAADAPEMVGIASADVSQTAAASYDQTSDEVCPGNEALESAAVFNDVREEIVPPSSATSLYEDGFEDMNDEEDLVINAKVGSMDEQCEKQSTLIDDGSLQEDAIEMLPLANSQPNERTPSEPVQMGENASVYTEALNNEDDEATVASAPSEPSKALEDIVTTEIVTNKVEVVQAEADTTNIHVDDQIVENASSTEQIVSLDGDLLSTQTEETSEPTLTAHLASTEMEEGASGSPEGMEASVPDLAKENVEDREQSPSDLNKVPDSETETRHPIDDAVDSELFPADTSVPSIPVHELLEGTDINEKEADVSSSMSEIQSIQEQEEPPTMERLNDEETIAVEEMNQNATILKIHNTNDDIVRSESDSTLLSDNSSRDLYENEFDEPNASESEPFSECNRDMIVSDEVIQAQEETATRPETSAMYLEEEFEEE